MNIFALSSDPKEAARMLCDKHIVKMILESAQMLCTVHHHNQNTNIDYTSIKLYKPISRNHPCTLWVAKSLANYRWLTEHALEMCDEYERRYYKEHKTKGIILWTYTHQPNIKDIGLTEFALAMPNECKQSDPIQAYRDYYKKYKSKIARWKRNNKPYWY